VTLNRDQKLSIAGLQINPLDLLSKAVFAILCLSILWVASGTNASLFWSRAPLFSLISILICVGFASLDVEIKPLLSKPNAQEVKTAYFLSLALLIPTGMLMVTLLKVDPTLYSSPGALSEFFGSFPLLAIVPLALSAYAIELFSRGYLQSQWGSNNVVLLEALVCGVAFQHISAFIVVYIAGLASIYILKKYNLKTAALLRMFWTLMLIIGLRIAST